jgi:hypothetical protein
VQVLHYQYPNIPLFQSLWDANDWDYDYDYDYDYDQDQDQDQDQDAKVGMPLVSDVLISAWVLAQGRPRRSCLAPESKALDAFEVRAYATLR